MPKIKTYIANSVALRHVPEAHRASNGNCQFSIVCRASSQAAVARLCGTGLSVMRSFNGIHEAPAHLAAHALEDNAVYYNVEHTKNGFVGKWFKYSPPVIS